MTLSIMKILDESRLDRNNQPLVKYILHPDRIFELHDSEKGCIIKYTHPGGQALIKGHSARQIKRSIQDQLDHPIGFLKTEYTYQSHEGLRYFNVDHIAAVNSRTVFDTQLQKVVNRCEILFAG